MPLSLSAFLCISALGILDQDEFRFNQLVSKASLASCAAKQLLCITGTKYWVVNEYEDA
jgi:hypothetical protein